MRIMIVYPGHSHSTVDVGIGYENALRQLGHDVYAYNYHLSLTFYDEALGHMEKINPNFHREAGDFLMLASERIAVEAIDFVPDVAIVVCGMALHRRGFEMLSKLRIPYIMLFTESPYQDETQMIMTRKTLSAGALVNDKSSVNTFNLKLGIPDYPVEYIPHSFDPTRHKYDKTAVKDTDVFFFGTMWPERKALFDGLVSNGYCFDIDGINPALTREDKLKFKTSDDMVAGYNRSKISINHHRTIVGVHEDKQQHIYTGASLGPRAYEIAACRAFQLSDDSRPELRQVFGDSVATYNSRKQLQDRIDYYLKHDDEREDMAREAYERVQSCSFYWRAKTILLPFIKEVI